MVYSKGSQPLPVKVNFANDEAADIVSVAAGKLHSLFLTRDGSVYGVGEGFNGQLGLYFEDGEERKQEAPRLLDTFPSSAGPIAKIIAGDYSSAAISGK